MYTKFVWTYERFGKVDWWGTRILNVRFACAISRNFRQLVVPLVIFTLLDFGCADVLTHTVTHTGIRTETAGYLRVGSSSRFVLYGPLLHDLIHKIAHLFCCLLLLLARGVGVGS